MKWSFFFVYVFHILSPCTQRYAPAKNKNESKQKNGENPTDCQKWNTNDEAYWNIRNYAKTCMSTYTHIQSQPSSKWIRKRLSLFLSLLQCFCLTLCSVKLFFFCFHDCANPSMFDFDRKTFCNPHIFLCLGCNVMLSTCTIFRLTAQWSRQKLTNYLLDMEVDMRLLFVGFIFGVRYHIEWKISNT